MREGKLMIEVIVVVMMARIFKEVSMDPKYGPKV